MAEDDSRGPSLVHSDDDEQIPGDPHAALVDEVRSNSQNKDALAYLLRYETMVRQQEAEDMSVIAHLRPCLERLQELAGIDDPFAGGWSDPANSLNMTKEIAFSDLKMALEALEDQDGGKTEFLTTDRQLMMVLRMLTQKVVSDEDATEEDSAVTITWAEFIQCYKVCIVGMQTLQHLPTGSRVRSRARDRTLSMMSLFEPPSTKLFQDDFQPVDSGALTQTRSRAAPTKLMVDAVPSVVSSKVSSKRSRLYGLVVIACFVAAAGYYANMHSDDFTQMESENSKKREFAATKQVVPEKTAQPIVVVMNDVVPPVLNNPLNTPVVKMPLPKKQPVVPRYIPKPEPVREVAAATARNALEQTPQAAQRTSLSAVAVGSTVGLVSVPMLMPMLSAAAAGGTAVFASVAVVAFGLASAATAVMDLLLKAISRPRSKTQN